MSDGSAPPRSVRFSRIAVFLAVSFAFSWIQWLAVIASQRGWIAADVGLTPVAQFGPLVGALCVMALSSREERSRWSRSLVRWRVAPHLMLIACFALPLVFAVCLLIANAFTADTAALGMPSFATIAAIAAGMFVFGGGMGEEPGWRGFLLPELRRSLGPVSASLFVAIAWFGWHLPLFWIHGATQQDLGVSMFALGIVSYTFIMTRLADRSGDSTLLAMLFHGSANTTFWLAMTTVRHTPRERVFLPLYVGMLAVLGGAAWIALVRMEHPARGRPAPHED